MKHAPLFSLCTLLASTALGCAGDGFEGEGDNRDEAAALESGTFFNFAVPTRDGCEADLSDILSLEETSIKVAEDGSTMILDTGDVKLDCAAGKTKGSYECAAKPETLELEGMKIVIESEMTLRVTSGDRLEGSFVIIQTCTGDECAVLGAAADCSAEGKVVAVRAMPDKFVPQVGAYDGVVGKPLMTTCDIAPDVAAAQKLRIEVQDDGTAKVFADGDPIPHDCHFAGQGRTVCSRLEEGAVNSFAQVDAAWTSASSFEGTAHVELSCPDDADCSGSEFGELPCEAAYHIKGTAAAAK